MRKIYSICLHGLLICLHIQVIGASAQQYYSFGSGAREEHGVNVGCWFEVAGVKHFAISTPYGFEYFVEQLDTAGNHCLVQLDGPKVFSLNAERKLDLSKEQLAGDKQVRFLGHMDVDRDGSPDLILQTDNNLSWLRNTGNGTYASAKELVRNLPARPDVHVFPAGVLIVTSASAKSCEIVVTDCRNGVGHIEVQRRNFRNSYRHVGMLEEEGKWFACLSSDASTFLLASMKGSEKDRDFSFPEEVDKIILSDFNKDGLLEYGCSDYLDVRIFGGDAVEKSVQSSNLLEPFSEEFIAQLVQWEKHQYAGFDQEEYKKQCLDWLAEGNLMEIDLNGDDFPDILYQGEYFVAFINEAGKGFRREFMGGPYDADVYKLVDLNKDERPEILIDAFNGQFLIQFDGTHFKESLIVANGYMLGFAALDMDQDGDLDLVFYNASDKLLWSENINGAFRIARTFEQN